jgi:hypothetical protein
MLKKASYSIKENLELMELQFKLLLHAFQNSFTTIHWMFNVHINFMCRRQEHVISCVPDTTELLVTCYTVIWRITQLYAQVFLTSHASHSSCSTCCNVPSLHRRNAHQLSATLCNTHNSSQLDGTIFLSLWTLFFIETKLTHLLRRKIILIIQKIIFSCTVCKAVSHINRMHENFFLIVHNKFSQNKSMY